MQHRSVVLLLLLVSVLAVDLEGSARGATGEFWPVDPVLETVKDGYIDWTAGRIYAWGRTRPADARPVSGTQSFMETLALKAARVRLREILDTLRLGNDLTLEGRDGGAAAADWLTGRADLEKMRTRRSHSPEAQVSAPLYGRGGIVSKLDGSEDPDLWSVQVPPGGKAHKGKGPSGVIIDARGTGLKPSLFPRVVGADGRLLWSWETADIEARLWKGVASYGRVLRTPMQEPSQVDWQRNQILSRMGETPVILKAAGATGSDSCDIVLHGEAEEQISSDDGLRKLLALGRLVVVVD